MIKSFRDLDIYNIALKLAKDIYKVTESFPRGEIYGLRDQVRRAVASIGANIAEGFGRYHYKDKVLFFYNARGSLYETIHFIELASELDYLSEVDKERLLKDTEILAMKLNKFITVIGKNSNDQ